MNVNLWLKKAKTKVDSIDAELILIHVLDVDDRSFIAGHGDFEISPDLLFKLDGFLKRREKGEPLAYVLGKREFYGRDFFVDNNVLIPRVESESIIDLSKKLEPKTILDVGTGSGCLAVTLKLEIPNAEVHAVDISDEALRVARKNAKFFNADVVFSKSDLMKNVDGNFDLIVANLPYVDRKWNWISKELIFEPEISLFAEDDGMFLVKKMIEEAISRTKYLIIESDTSQQKELIEYADKIGFSVFRKDDFVIVFRAV